MSKSVPQDEMAAWIERASIARKYGNEQFAAASDELASRYKTLIEQDEQSEPDTLTKARQLRKTLEASEQHRTMCVEHGLSDAAIDATYEIQEIESQIVHLVQKLS